MKTSKTKFIVAMLAALFPFSVFAADHANCPMAGTSGDAGCCSMSTATAADSAFAPPPRCPMIADSARVTTSALTTATPMASSDKALSEADTAFLAGYEKIHMALVSDDLAAAKSVAASLDGGADIASAKSLKDARAAFKTLSAKAIAIGKGHEGLYVLHCPMANADWLQTSKDVKNPYYGKAMPTCGVVKE